MTPLEKLIAVFNRHRADNGELPITASDYVISAPSPYKGPMSDRNTRITLRTKKPVNGKYKIYYLYYNRINLSEIKLDLIIDRGDALTLADLLARCLNDEMRVDFDNDDFERVVFEDGAISFRLKATSRNIIFIGEQDILFAEYANSRPNIQLVEFIANLASTITFEDYDISFLSTVKLEYSDTTIWPAIVLTKTEVNLKSSINCDSYDVDLKSEISLVNHVFVSTTNPSTIELVDSEYNLYSTVEHVDTDITLVPTIGLEGYDTSYPSITYLGNDTNLMSTISLTEHSFTDDTA